MCSSVDRSRNNNTFDRKIDCIINLDVYQFFFFFFFFFVHMQVQYKPGRFDVAEDVDVEDDDNDECVACVREFPEETTGGAGGVVESNDVTTFS